MKLIRRLAALAIAPALMLGTAAAQAPAPPPPADPNMAFVNQIMQTAAAVHALVKSMNLQQTFGAQNYAPGDPRSMQRTAEFMGMGAGVGLALGEMSHSPKGAAIGAAVGTAGGLIADQVLRHQAAKAQAMPPADQIPPDPPAKHFRERGE